MSTTSNRVAMNKLGMRRSCDRCFRRKKKCDSGTPCGACLGAGTQCTYSKRKWHQLPPQQSRHEHQQAGPAGMHGEDELLPSTSGAHVACGLPSFKRCRLSASPATGLVGMHENVFLSDFFCCVGFLPLTTQSHIRETMVNIMARPAIQQPTGDDFDEAEAFNAIAGGGNLISGLGGNELPMDPSMCIFWCAVALGALVKGYPIEAVANYTQMATDALGTPSGSPNTEVAQAWAILAYLYGLMGNQMKFQEYLDLSNSCLDASIEEGSFDTLPVGFAEMIGHTETIKVCSGSAKSGEIEAFCAQQQDSPQLNAGADERDLYKYVTLSFKTFEQAVFAKACESAAARGRSEDAQPREGDSAPHQDAPLPSEIADAMVTGLQEHMLEFEQLEETVDRPAIRNGIGSLIINGALVFKKAHKGDAAGTLERITRCVEVYERYPGLCRMTRWFHIALVMLIALAALGGPRTEELYARLRAAYNPFRPPGSRPVPPLEEWQGVSSFCDDLHCRSMEGVIGSGALNVFSTPRVTERKDGEVDEVLVAVNVSEEMEGPILVSPCSSGAELEATAGACSTTQATQVADSPPSACHARNELEVGANVSVSCSRDGVNASIDAPDMGFENETGDGDVDEASWLDVTHAMLSAIEGPDGPDSA